MSRLAGLTIADDPEAWRRVGFAVDESGRTQIGSVGVQIEPLAGESGVTGWTLAGMPDETVTDVDGLMTAPAEPPEGVPPAHPNGAHHFDHIVVTTPDVDQTVAAVERRLGVSLRRTRDGDAGGRPVRQAFFRLGEVILEVVGPPAPQARGGAAQFWGLVVTMTSLPEAVALLGPSLISEPRAAVQPGRSIATVRSAAGLAVPLALMSA